MILPGTCSDSPSKFAAAAPVGRSLIPSRFATATAASSAFGVNVPNHGWLRGRSYSPRATRLNFPAFVSLDKAVSTAARDPRSRKCTGEKARALLVALILLIIFESMLCILIV